MSRLLRIRAGDLSYIARALWYLLIAGWLLFVKRPPTSNWLTRWAGKEESLNASDVDYNTAKRAARWTNTVARYPFPWARCLQRSVALCMFMEHSGLVPVLRLGVRKDSSGFDAHAWVEYGGSVLNDSEHVRTKFESFRHGSGS